MNAGWSPVSTIVPRPKFVTTTMGAAVLKPDVVPSSSRYPAVSVSPGSLPGAKTRARTSDVAAITSGVPAVKMGDVESGTEPSIVQRSTAPATGVACVRSTFRVPVNARLLSETSTFPATPEPE